MQGLDIRTTRQTEAISFESSEGPKVLSTPLGATTWDTPREATKVTPNYETTHLDIALDYHEAP